MNYNCDTLQFNQVHPMNNTDYYEKTHALAAQAGITVARLCSHAGVAKATVSQWQGGDVTPNIRTWEKIQLAAQQLKKRRAKSARVAA
jgi:transcriptional regulator with XRE-family HTH domain